MSWKFEDPPNLAVIVDAGVFTGNEFIMYVYHDDDDGGWQFLGKETDTSNTDSATVVGLGEVIAIDPTIEDLFDLPMGWRAWRASQSAPWVRAKV